MENRMGRDFLEEVTLTHPSVSSVDSWGINRHFAKNGWTSWERLVGGNLEKSEGSPLPVRPGALAVLDSKGLHLLLLLDRHRSLGWRWKVYWKTPRESMN
jgi:hypothetical protein